MVYDLLMLQGYLRQKMYWRPHYSALLKALEEITKVQQGVGAGISGDLLSIDIRQALYHFGEITGEITSDDLLGNIFANFCIGK